MSWQRPSTMIVKPNFRRAYKLIWALRTDALKTIGGSKFEDILDSYPLLTKKIYVRFSERSLGPIAA